MATYQNARKDVNSVATLCGISDLDGSVMPLQIDPVTNAVLVEVTSVSSLPTVLSPGYALKDVNSVATQLGVADDGSGLLVPTVYHVNGTLYVYFA